MKLIPEEIEQIQGQEQWERFNEEQALIEILEEEIAKAEELHETQKLILRQKEHWGLFLKLMQS